MAAVIAISGSGPTTPVATTTPPHIVRLWRDNVRVEQLARFRSLDLQAGDDYGLRAWELAHEQWRQLPEGARIDLPSPHVFGRVLGLFRTGALLKTGKLLRLEISAEEIADLLGYSKATVEAALRWLGSGPIEHLGDQLARGLGVIHRGRRTAFAFLEGTLRRVYRTSRTILTSFGRLLLGLGLRDDERKAERREFSARVREEVLPVAPAIAPEHSTEKKYIEGLGSDGGGQGTADGMTAEVARYWIDKIKKSF